MGEEVATPKGAIGISPLGIGVLVGMSNLTKTTSLVVRPQGAKPLPDNAQWMNRFEIRSSSSNRVYIVAQNKASEKFGCSCPSFRVRRRCKHLLDGCALQLSQIHGQTEMEMKRQQELK
jgi:hypothetical protein